MKFRVAYLDPTGLCTRLSYILAILLKLPINMWIPEDINILESSDEATTFILMAWAEFFSKDIVPDSFRPRLMDSLQLLKELNQLAIESEKNEIWIRYLPDLIEELRMSIKHDPIIDKLYPQIKNSIISLNLTDKNLPAQVLRLSNVAIAELKDYSHNIDALLYSSCENMPHEKKNMHDVLMRLASRALLNGVDKLQCGSVVSDQNLLCHPKEIINKIIESTKPNEREWFCIIPLDGQKSVIRSFISKTDFVDLPKNKKPYGDNGKLFMDKTENFIHITKTVKAKSPIEAIRACIQDLRVAVDITNFYHNSAPVRIHNHTIAVHDKTSELIDINDHYYSKLTPRSGAKKLISDALEKNIQSNKILINALEQHTIAYSSVDIKVRFLNLWVALESLVGRSKSKPIIERVIDFITPILVGTRIRRQIKYLSVCLHKWGFCNTISDDSGFFKVSSAKGTHINRGELFKALIQPANSTVIEELCYKVKNNRLLLFRLKMLSDILCKKGIIYADFKGSEERIKWQLKRIYKARNLLVHQGIEDSNLPYLLNNLQYYFSLSISRIINELKYHPKWSIEDCFEYKKIEYNYLLKLLKDSKQIKISKLIHDKGHYMNELF